MMRSGYIVREELRHILSALTAENRLACEISESTGLRIGDVLLLRREQLLKGPRLTIREQKTGKTRRVYLPADLYRRALGLAGSIYVFEGRLDGRKHRTRQAVYKDLRRAARLFRCRAHLSPHSCRKVWAVNAYKASGGDLKRVQHLLNHESEAVTMLYALADELTERRTGRRAATSESAD